MTAAPTCPACKAPLDVAGGVCVRCATAPPSVLPTTEDDLTLPPLAARPPLVETRDVPDLVPSSRDPSLPATEDDATMAPTPELLARSQSSLPSTRDDTLPSSAATSGSVDSLFPDPASRGELALPGDLESRFEVLRVLGKGGMGVVLLCKDKRLQREVAVKLLTRQGHHLDELLRQEAQVLAGLEHPHVVRLYDFGQSDGKPYLVMELVRGRSLAARLASGRPTLVEAVRMATEIVAGVQVAHERGIAHFDIKPANIFLDEAGSAKVADFGLARTVVLEGKADPSGKKSFIGGTPGYMAPEQSTGTAGRPADVYAIGVVLHEMLTGRSLFRGRTLPDISRIQREEPIPRPSIANPSVPPVLEELVVSCLSVDPGSRPTLAHMAQVLGEWLGKVTRHRSLPGAQGFPSHPYRFLEWFEVEDAPIFFGRNAETAELAELVARPAIRMVQVFGPCGIGKSSVIRAGLARAVDPAKVDILILTAGPDPARRIMEALAERAGSCGSRDPDLVGLRPEDMEAEPARVERVLLALGKATGKTLGIVLDQTEEVFTQNPRGSPRATALFELIGRMVETLSLPVKLIVTYRTEFRGEFFPLEQRHGTAQQSFALDEIDDQGLLEAIEGPSFIEAYGFSYQKGLARTIGADIRKNAVANATSALPILQIVCRQLYEKMKAGGQRVISTDLYARELGGAQGALQRYVEDRLASPAYVGRAGVARQILEALTIQEGDRERFARAREEEDLLDFPDRDGAARILEQLISDRLVVRDLDQLERRGVRLASEVICPLIDRWAESPDSTQLAGRALARAHRLWLERRSSENLLAGSQLALVQAEIPRLRGLSGAEREFVSLSVQQARAALVTRLGAALLILASLGGWIYTKYFAPGVVRLDSDPAGAVVSRSGESLGTTPLVWRGSPGTYAMRLELPDHDTVEATVKVSPGGETASTQILRFRKGLLDVRTDPPSASVVVTREGSDTSTFATPLTTEIERGVVSLTVTAPGWRTKVVPGVKIQDGRRLTHHLVKLERNMGWLAAPSPRLKARLVLTESVSGRVVQEATLPAPEPILLPSGRYLAECIPADGGRVNYRSVEVGVGTTTTLSPWIPAVETLWTAKGLHSTGPGNPGDLDQDGIPDLVLGSREGVVHGVSGRTGKDLWTHPTDGAVRGVPALADLDGDGVPDAVVTSRDGFTYAVSGSTGARLWVQASGDEMQVSPAVADLDRDGRPDLVVASSDHRVTALRGRDGKELWSVPTGAPVFADPQVTDVTGDGTPDVVVGSYDHMVYALDGLSGKVLWKRDVGGQVGVGALLTRVDEDSILDALVMVEDRSVQALSGKDGTVIWVTREAPGMDGAAVLCGDADGDGVQDMVGISSTFLQVLGISGKTGRRLWSFTVADRLWPAPASMTAADGAPRVVVASPRQVYILDPSGRPLWGLRSGGVMSEMPAITDLDGDRWPDLVLMEEDQLLAVSGALADLDWAYQTGGTVRGRPAIADLDGDEDPDVVAGSQDGRMVGLSGSSGQPLWTYEAGSPLISDPMTADLDGDGTADVVTTSDDEKVHAVSGRTGKRMWVRPGPGMVDTSVALADLDRDGRAEVIVGTDKGTVQALAALDGSTLWTFPGLLPVTAPPGTTDLDGDGVPDVVVGTRENVQALAGGSGKPLWDRATGGQVDVILVTREGDLPRIYLGTMEGRVLAIDGETGAELWKSEIRSPIRCGPALRVSAGGGPPDLVFGAGDGRMRALSSADGSLRWKRDLPEGSFARQQPVTEDVDGDGEADVLLSQGGSIHVLSGVSGRILTTFPERHVGFLQPHLVRAGAWAPRLITASAATVVSRFLHCPPGKPGGKTLWRHDTGAGITASVAVGEVPGTGRSLAFVSSPDGILHAVSAKDGARQWSWVARKALRASPALGDLTGAGRLEVLAAADSGQVVALDAETGSMRWTFVTSAPVIASPAVTAIDGEAGLDGIVVTKPGRMVALSGKSGRELWSAEVGAPVLSSPAIGDLAGNGELAVVVGADDGRIRAFRVADGTPLWTGEAGKRVRSSPAVVPGVHHSSLVVCGAGDEGLVALSGRNGSRVWSVRAGGNVDSSPAVGDLDQDGSLEVVVGANDGTVRAVRAGGGEPRWVAQTGGRVTGRPALVDLEGDERVEVVIGAADGLVYAFEGETGKLIWKRGGGGAIEWSSVAPWDVDGDWTLDLIFGTQSGNVSAVSGGTGRPGVVRGARGPWFFTGAHVGR